ncbi:MAG: hypothetical protein K0Q46_2731 [Rhodococcus erythropolis]|nr:hypothetical protein [Rhodococcus erythropolis]
MPSISSKAGWSPTSPLMDSKARPENNTPGTVFVPLPGCPGEFRVLVRMATLPRAADWGAFRVAPNATVCGKSNGGGDEEHRAPMFRPRLRETPSSKGCRS